MVKQVTKPNGRTRRSPINGSRNILTVSGKEPDYEYRIVNDLGDRVAIMQENGYEIVSDNNVKVGDRRIANPTQEGTPVKVSVGGGVQGYLMRIPKEFYDEDQASKQSVVDETELAMKKDAAKSSDYGNLKVFRD